MRLKGNAEDVTTGLVTAARDESDPAVLQVPRRYTMQSADTGVKKACFQLSGTTNTSIPVSLVYSAPGFKRVI